MKAMKRAVVAMSGGVDSSVAALLLKEEGYDVTGVSLRLLSAERRGLGGQGYSSFEAADDAADVAQGLDIPHYVIDAQEDFRREVIDYFCGEYLDGRTPNPCILCNEKVKFGSLLSKAKELGADYVATGHYASVERDAESGRYFVREGRDKAKDQSYALFSLSQEQLRHALLPLGDYTKEEVRNIARSRGLKVCDKSDSQEICFVSSGDYRQFVSERDGASSAGRIVDKQGRQLGSHRGIAFYTVGQRKGLGIAAGRPLYVLSIDAENNSIVVGDSEEAMRKELTACRTSWMFLDGLSGAVRAQAKIRYNHDKAGCKVIPLSEGEARVIFDEPQYAVTPGQAVVFYEGEKVLGGGWIK